MLICPNEEYSELIKESLENRPYNSYTKVNSNYAMKDYINRIYENKTDRTLRQKINNRYRDTTQQFSDNLYSEFALKSQMI